MMSALGCSPLTGMFQGGCLYAEISTLARPGAESARRYRILPADPNRNPDDIEFAEYAAQVGRELDQQGFQPAANEADAEVVILLSYRRGPPLTESTTTSSPHEEYVPSRTVTVTGRDSYARPVTSQVEIPGGYRVTGRDVHTSYSTSYERLIVLQAFDAREFRGGRRLEIWRTTITSTGSGSDLRAVFADMLIAAGQHIGRRTDKAVRVSVKLHSPEARALQGRP